MKIVGDTWVETERVISEKITKNVCRYKIERVSRRALLLECGHTIDYGRFAGKVPTVRTECYECNPGANFR